MGDQRWDRMWELFHAAIEKPEDQRTAFLDQACEGDAALREEVAHLISVHGRTTGVLERHQSVPVAGSELLHDPLIGERIGPYRILEVIGEGGMGVVYEAEQLEPVRRRVALKVIRLGMDTEKVVARFNAERQALALMNHPGIASVFDAGSSDAGRPYFVMELVEGRPITTYCDEQQLGTAERLELFLEVCDGLRHAHQKGVIHRDIKPSNLLIAQQDGIAAPKIIDFGIAKAIEQKLTEQTVFTVLGDWVGTPEYMSPEQAGLDGADIDTRTDVYSLGVLLYELLVGALPFDSKDLREAGFDELRRKIREDEPSKPSTRIDTLDADASTDTARNRRTDLASLRTQLTGDLDWITMKALEKDRERRYGSVTELADDIGRHIRDEPVLAGPPSAGYRAGKFIRRHKVGVGFAAVALLSVVTIAGVMTVQAERVSRQRDRANAEAERARIESATASQVADFMVELFEVSSPSEAQGDSITAREALDRGAEKIETLADQPQVQARMYRTIGDVYRSLGQYDEAERLLVRGLEVARAELGDDHVDTLASLDRLGKLAWDREELQEAADYHRQALEGRRRVLGSENADTASSMNNYGLALDDLGRLDEAEPLLRESLEVRRRVLGDTDEKTIVSLLNMGRHYSHQRMPNEAEPFLVEALQAAREGLGNDHPMTLNAMNNMGVHLLQQGRLEEAQPYLVEALEGHRRVHGEDHRETLNSLGNVCVVLMRSRKSDEAEPYCRSALEGKRRVLGDDSLSTLVAMNTMAHLKERQQSPEAEQLHRDVVAAAGRALGGDHPYTLKCTRDLAVYLQRANRLEEAESYFRTVLDLRTQKLGADHVDTLTSAADLGVLLARTQRHEEAISILAPAIDGLRGRFSPMGIASFQRYRGQAFQALGRFEEAETALLEAHELAEATLGADNPQTAILTKLVVALYEEQGKTELAGVWRARLPAE